ncbi:MAG: D-aminoacyl-tRNA deacylase [Promethearchaeota archaeon]
MKSTVIVTSIEDIASQNIKSRLLEEFKCKCLDHVDNVLEVLHDKEKNVYIVTIKEPLVESEDLDKYCSENGIEPSCYLFASRHRSETAKPSLLAHVTGNWNSSADLGGSPRDVCVSSGRLLRAAFLSLIKQKDKMESDLDKFSINLEVTHHGPTNLHYPLVFIELGSDEENWRDENGGLAICRVIVDLVDQIGMAGHSLDGLCPDCGGVAIGFGGPHYAATFDRVIRKTGYAFSHLVPKHAILDLRPETVQLAIDRTVEPISCFILDWKGLNREQKEILLPMLEKFDIPVKRAKNVIKSFLSGE